LYLPGFPRTAISLTLAGDRRLFDKSELESLPPRNRNEFFAEVGSNNDREVGAAVEAHRDFALADAEGRVASLVGSVVSRGVVSLAAMMAAFSGMGRADQRGTAGTADEEIIAHLVPVSYSGSLDSPFVVLFEQDVTDEANHDAVVGKMPTTSVRHLISPLRRSIGLVLTHKKYKRDRGTVVTGAKGFVFLSGNTRTTDD
jgi:hypothetical protein